MVGGRSKAPWHGDQNGKAPAERRGKAGAPGVLALPSGKCDGRAASYKNDNFVRIEVASTEQYTDRTGGSDCELRACGPDLLPGSGSRSAGRVAAVCDGREDGGGFTGRTNRLRRMVVHCFLDRRSD